MRTTSFTISDDFYRRVRYAASALGVSPSEYIRRALVCTMAADAMENTALGAAFHAMDELKRR